MRNKLLVQNADINSFIKNLYNERDLQAINDFLQIKGVFNFPSLDNGLFPAAIVDCSTEYTGYAAVWVRDNFYISYSYYIYGEHEVVKSNISTLMKYFRKHSNRFKAIIDDVSNVEDEMLRPHIRFNGNSLEEIDQKWGHAQNDALGYFLWFYCKLLLDRIILPTYEDFETLSLFPFYFDAISYWRDEDSGHWEEDRKIEASSIGVVVESLKALRQVTDASIFSSFPLTYKETWVTKDYLDELIKKGCDSLNSILPYECRQEGKERLYDSALLFLLYPLNSLNEASSEVILTNTTNNLLGDYGISRYLGDSFWCRDYEDLPQSIRTSISSDREKWFLDQGRHLVKGEEAQWCIFDPIISIIYGEKYRRTGDVRFLEMQTHHLNRSLGQLTPNDSKLGGFKCPELYYIKNGTYVPNDATPLLWTQANLRIALMEMSKSVLVK